MTSDIKFVPLFARTSPDTSVRGNNWIEAVATCGLLVGLWGNVTKY